MMETLYNHWLALPVAVLLTIAAGLVDWRGFKNLRHGLRNSDDPDHTLFVVRGIRGGIVALGLLSCAAGLYFKVAWPLWFGLAFLAEELLETGIMVAALRSQKANQ